MKPFLGHAGVAAIVPLTALLCFSGCHLDRVPRADDRTDAGPVRTPDAGRDGGECVCAEGCTDPMCQPAKRPNGQSCRTNSECESAHCRNGLCCTEGRCCMTADECGGQSGLGAVCDRPETCQGRRGVPACEDFMCQVAEGEEDDSACTASTEALPCGFYPSVFCNGEADQTVGTCATRCEDNDDCDQDGFCDDDATCQPKLQNGQACDQHGDCASANCTNQVCCRDGDCCATTADCDAYNTEPMCAMSSACRGTRREAQCVDFQCSSSDPVRDDSACDASVVAQECGLYASARCNGSASQTAPSCAASCDGDEDCAANAYCDTGDMSCKSELADGEVCDRAAQCQSDHCQNGFCCVNGDCCATAPDCPPGVGTCLNTVSCQGVRREMMCSNHQCSMASSEVDDDSACAGMTSLTCGAYADIQCTDEIEQTAPACPNACEDSLECDLGASCTGDACVAD